GRLGQGAGRERLEQREQGPAVEARLLAGHDHALAAVERIVEQGGGVLHASLRATTTRRGEAVSSNPWPSRSPKRQATGRPAPASSSPISAGVYRRTDSRCRRVRLPSWISMSFTSRRVSG